MGKLVLECLERKINTKKIAKAVYTVLEQQAKIKAELVFDSESEMKELNFVQRGIDSVTDVLSFPTLDGIKGRVLFPEDCKTEMERKYIFIGSIVICDEKVRMQAKEYGHSEERERTYLIVHGLMHLFGCDHMTDEDKKEMREKEKAALALLGIEDEE